MFRQNKYTKWYFSIIENANKQNRVKLKKTHHNYIYYENHHIIPKSLGGTNNKSNLILLTAKEHFVVHILLPKMCISTKNTQQMITALFKMQNKNSYQNDRYFNSRLYEYYKKQIIYPIDRKIKQREIVSCKNIITNEYLQVSRNEFLNNPNLVGVNYGRKQSIEQRKNHSDKMKGSNNPFFGKKHPKEIQDKINANISKSLKGVPKTKEWKEKMRDSWKKRKSQSI